MSEPVKNYATAYAHAAKSTAIERGFNLNLLASFPIAKLNEYLKENLHNLTQGADGNLVAIESLKLYQSDDKLVVQANLSKPFKGKVYLWGTTKLDTLTSMLSLQDLAYTEESKSVIGQVAGWLLHIPAVENLIISKFQYRYEKNIQDAITKLADIRQAVSPNVFLIGQLKSAGPVAINISDNTINAVLNLKGNILLQIK